MSDALTSAVISPIIVALDKSDFNSAMALAETLDPALCRVKVGKELFTRCGAPIVEALQNLGFEVFLDLKFHDIPNTTAQAVLAAADLGVFMVNVHASCGEMALRLAKTRLQDGGYSTLLIAVTVLTSMTAQDLAQIGVNRSPADQVEHLSLLAKNAGLDGVVCSAQEAKRLKTLCGQDFKLVTPGIRLPNDNTDDQARICTPTDAIQNGSDFLVIGRPITAAPDPLAKLKEILASLPQNFSQP